MNPETEKRYPNWRDWWLVGKFKAAYPHDMPTPGHLQCMATIVEGLGAPWNIPTNWAQCKWYEAAKGAISFTYGGTLASYDNARLTDLVVAAHANAVRVELEPCNPQYLRIRLYPRRPAASDSWARHPTLDQLESRIRGEALAVALKAGI